MRSSIQTITNQIPDLSSANEQQQHALLEAVLNSSAHISIVSLNKNYCYTSFSRSHSISMKELFGVEIEKGKNLLEYIPDRVTRQRIKASIDRVLQGETFNEIQVEPLSKKYYELYWNPVVRDKKIIGVSAFIQNITDRKLAEKALRKSEAQLKMGEVFAKFGTWKLDLNEGMVYASAGAKRIYGTNKEKITISELKEFRLPEYSDMLDEALKRLIEKNETYDIDFKIKRESDGKITDVHSKAVYDAATNTVSGSLQDITDRKQAAEALIKSELLYRSVLNASPDGIVITDLEGRLQLVSPAALKIFGYQHPLEVLSRPITDFVIDTDKDRILGNIAKMLQQSKSSSGEYTGLRRDASSFPVEVNTNIIRSITGVATNLITVIRDITQRKQLEALERESKDRIIKIASQVPGVIYQFRLHPDGSYEFPFASESLNAIFQVSPEEFYADPGSAFKKIHPEDYPGFHESILTSAKNLTPWQHGCRVVLNDGSIRHMYGSSVPEPEADGSVLWHGFLTDITEHKFAEERIRQLSKAVEQSPVSIVITDTAGAIQYVNPKFAELTGYSVEEVIGKNPGILKSGHTSEAEYQDLWKTINSGITWHGDLQNKKKNGDLYWESATISPVLNEHGAITHFLAVKEDITERVLSEQKLQQGLKSYEFVNKATSDTIWEWDIKANTINRNESFYKTFGYSADSIDKSPQWAGKNIHPDDHQRVEEIIDNCIANKLENWQAEYRYADAGGMYRYVYDRAYVLFDADGNPQRMYGAMTDLTEKQNLKTALAEQQLKQQKQLLEVNIQAHEEEKSELGKELHDNISQMLATVKMYLGLAKAGRQVPDVDIIGMSYNYVEETITELRKLSHSLVPPSLGEMGLQEALEELINIANAIKDISVKLVIDSKIKRCHFGKKMELMIYRIVQEQLNNIGKYARAKNVSVVLKKEKETLQLTVTDDGVGFDVSAKGKGIGLRNMLNRVEFYSGTLQVISAPGSGCKIIVRIPFDFNKACA